MNRIDHRFDHRAAQSGAAFTPSQATRPCQRGRLHLLSSVVLVAGLFLLAGCLPVALLPFYKESDVIHDPALLGFWKSDDNTSWKFEPGKDNAYRVSITDEDGTGPFVAYLFQLGEQRFLDLLPDNAGLEDFKRSVIYKVALVPGHVLFRVDQVSPQLQMQALKEDWTRDWLEDHPDALAHHLIGEGKDTRVVLTASTAALQGFIKQHLPNTNAWSTLKPFNKD